MAVEITEARYPGDHISIQRLRRGDEVGDVRVQFYGKGSLRVGMFCPGREVWSEGDTPKVEPEQSTWCRTPAKALVILKSYVRVAKSYGWEEWRPGR